VQADDRHAIDYGKFRGSGHVTCRPWDASVSGMSIDHSAARGDPQPHGSASQPTLIALLRGGTRELHVQAERSGIVRKILQGHASALGYAMYLRNLLPAYRMLEGELDRHRSAPAIRNLVRPEIYRSHALELDLLSIHGPQWRELPVLPSASRYERQISASTRAGALRLIGHAYTRYLGDLSGGQVMKRLLAKTLSLNAEQMRFHAFPAIADIESFKCEYCSAIDLVGTMVDDVEPVIVEAKRAFELNIALSNEIAREVE
jgi:heme oxygenase